MPGMLPEKGGGGTPQIGGLRTQVFPVATDTQRVRGRFSRSSLCVSLFSFSSD